MIMPNAQGKPLPSEVTDAFKACVESLIEKEKKNPVRPRKGEGKNGS